MGPIFDQNKKVLLKVKCFTLNKDVLVANASHAVVL
jgi:hypothetical protein